MDLKTLQEEGEREFDEKVAEVQDSREVVKEFGYKTYGSDGYVWTVTDWGNIKTHPARKRKSLQGWRAVRHTEG